MKIYDITIDIKNDMIIWPGDPKISIKNKISIQTGGSCNVKSITISSHTGTHIDSPNHFIENGYFINDIPLETMMGKCFVVDLTHVSSIIDVENLINIDYAKYSRILFKTRNSDYLFQKEFNKNFISLSLEAAKYLSSKKVLLIGIDYLSIESFYSNGDVHNQLLSNEIAVVESINLSGIAEGEYELICLPIKINKCDGAPARVLLKSYNE